MRTPSFFLTLTAVLCALWLTACAQAPEATARDAVPTPAASPAATAAPTAAPSPAAATPAPDAADGGGDRFDPKTADYTGTVTELTDTGFLLSPTEVVSRGAGYGILAEGASGSAEIPVACTEATSYIALYAGADGSSRQEPGTADLLTPDAYVYLTGHEADGVFIAATVAVLNP